jgi:hypothetical protein
VALVPALTTALTTVLCPLTRMPPAALATSGLD